MAAVPGGVLATLLVLAVLKHFEPMPMMLKVCVLVTLVLGAVMLLSPVAVLLGFGVPGGAGTAKKKGSEEPSEPEIDEEGMMPAGAVADDDEELEELTGADEFDEFDGTGEDDYGESAEATFEEADDFDELSGASGEAAFDEFDDFDDTSAQSGEAIFEDDFSDESAGSGEALFEEDSNFEFEEFDDEDEDR